ncbi:unnamed protein product [Strongylus vulgaris]|uniref:Uncharacterized protein n=1 Tax=Strongylus vulgaris TaxID=40348 RepID=A0A3P7JH78_STRVU|nr:unnamed protein product [Strongylus vulgaris]
MLYIDETQIAKQGSTEIDERLYTRWWNAVRDSMEDEGRPQTRYRTHAHAISAITESRLQRTTTQRQVITHTNT